MAGVFQIMSGNRHGLIYCSVCIKIFTTVDEARTHHITDPGHRQKYARVVSIVSGKCLSTPKLTKVRPNSLALHTFIMRKISAGEIWLIQRFWQNYWTATIHMPQRELYVTVFVCIMNPTKCCDVTNNKSLHPHVTLQYRYNPHYWFAASGWRLTK